ncbi:glycosyltransferase family 9 protein [Mesorhizobium sp. M7D.F.Ca.US.005.01.1.1]|uniref:glycosyltransferase family 9 protein n=1 Tax=Mesorhizobium sp. M7D.F.Ca.US.005.01.1.1 TaxID=2493678 RepID=UPI000F74C2B4|nr:glycosyltransferase family 9 protein [Mesorhizobium sp. M7D.F.Ca.US.005.01.1.1]AZO42327.1 glycosyltransferase family 9 protein [Mesorhizobium sp. M7D.F.Ca.US.005.01.1.1]
MLQSSPAPFHSILVIQTKFIGDLVLASALAQNLRLEFPGARLVFLCEARFESFVIAHGIASEVVTFRRARMRGTNLERGKELYAMIRALRRYRFDLTIDITDSKTSRIVSGLVNAKTRVGYKPSERPLRMLERQPANVFARPYGFDGQHFLYRYLSPLEALGIELRTVIPSLQPLPLETAKALALLGKHHLRPNAFIAMHAGASFEGRRWQPERFAAAIDEIAGETGLDIVLVGGPDEREIAEHIIASTVAPVVNLVGTLSLESLLAVLEQARLFLGNESGPMHMAAATGTPVVGLFGLTHPSRWGPIGVPSISLQPPMPCACVAKDLCRAPDPSKACCVWGLEVKPVVDAVRELLSRTEMKRERAV